MGEARLEHDLGVAVPRGDRDDALRAAGGAQKREEGVRGVADADDVGAELLRSGVRFLGGERKGRGGAYGADEAVLKVLLRGAR